MPLFIGGDFILGPRMEAVAVDLVGLRRNDGIGRCHALPDRELHQRAQTLAKHVRRRAVWEHRGHHVGDVTRLKVAHHCLAVFDAPPLDYAAIDLAGAFDRVEKVGRPIVARDEVIEAPLLDAAGARHDRLGAHTLLDTLLFLPEALGPRRLLETKLSIALSPDTGPR